MKGVSVVPLVGSKKFNVINQSAPRIDGYEKVTGKARYAADIYVEGMLYGGMLRSPIVCGKVTKIDAKKARAIPGVDAVVTFEEMTRKVSWAKYCYLTGDIRYVGDVVAIVAAQSRELVAEALEAIEVEYEERPGVFTIEEALEPNAPTVNPDYADNIFTDSYYKIRKGDVDQGFAAADVVLEREYRTQYVEHSYIEPEAVVAIPNANDGIMTVHASAQNPFFTRRYVADALGVSMAKVRLIQEHLGGTFGGKEEGVGLVAGRAAYLAQLTGKPVKMVFSREESFLESSKRHPFRFRYKAGVTKEGKIVAFEGEQVDNSGAYNNQTQFMNWRANAHSAGAYDIPNVKTDTYGVFTNNIHSGAFRGYSSPALIFAQEQFIDELAEAIGMDEVTFRKINCLKSGGHTATGTEVENVILEEMIDHAVKKTEYLNKRARYAEENKDSEKAFKKGIGMAIMHRSCGFGAEAPDASGCMMIINEDGSVLINSGLAENGQGLRTVYAQIAAEALGVTYDSIHFYGTDTHSIPDCGMTVASRGTAMGAQSVRKTGEKLKEIMKKNALELGLFDKEKARSTDDIELEGSFFFLKQDPSERIALSEMTGACLWSGKQLSTMEWYIPNPCVQDHDTGQGKACQTYAYGCVVAEVEVDTQTGYVDLKKVTACHDVGTAINPALILGQVYGGIVMGQGYAIMEDVVLDKGKVRSLNLDTYIIPTAMDMPEMDVCIFESDDENGTYGAKSVGEPATEGIAGAIANAIYNACGRRIRENPADLESVLLGKKLR